MSQHVPSTEARIAAKSRWDRFVLVLVLVATFGCYAMGAYQIFKRSYGLVIVDFAVALFGTVTMVIQWRSKR